jgi:hypothetical protein
MPSILPALTIALLRKSSIDRGIYSLACVAVEIRLNPVAST